MSSFDAAEHAKAAGNAKFKTRDWSGARKEYGTGLDALNAFGKRSDGEAQKDAAAALRILLLANRAACCLNAGKAHAKAGRKADAKREMEACADDCSSALDFSGKLPDDLQKSVSSSIDKVLYRRAQAYEHLAHLGDSGMMRKAFCDFHAVVQRVKGSSSASAAAKKGVARLSAYLRKQAENRPDHPITVLVQKLSEKGSDVESTLRQLITVVNDEGAVLSAVLTAEMASRIAGAASTDTLAVNVLAAAARASPGCLGALKTACATAFGSNAIKWISEQSEGVRESSVAAAVDLQLRMLEHSDEGTDIESVLTACLELLSNASTSKLAKRRCVHLLSNVCSGSKSNAELFFSIGGGDAIVHLADEESKRDASGEIENGASMLVASVLPALDDDDAMLSRAVDLVYPCLANANPVSGIAGLAVLNAVFAANAKLGVSLLQHRDLVAKIGALAQACPSRGQCMIANVLASAANTEDGRSLIRSTEGVVTILQHYAASTEAPLRSAAAVALTKLNAIKFDSASNEGMAILGSVLHLLRPDAAEAERARGVEAICFVISDTRVKQSVAFIQESAVLKSLISMASGRPAAKSPYAFGLTHIFLNLTRDELDKKREKLREMEVGLKEWEEFEKLTKSQTGGPGEKDTAEQVEARILAFVEFKGVAALVGMVRGGASGRTLGCVAKTLCQVASVQSVRGIMIAQGALDALVTIAAGDKCEEDEKAKLIAAHGIAKVLITTDPHLVQDSHVMDAMGPLIAAVKKDEHDLVTFEALMALTNLASLSVGTKERIVELGGIRAFGFAQYNDNLMVRRAATEALANLVPSEGMVTWLQKGDKLKFWLLLCMGMEDDMRTSSAATGALANLCYVPAFAESFFAHEGAVDTLLGLAGVKDEGVVHRAAVAMLGLHTCCKERDEDGAEVICKHSTLDRRKIFSLFKGISSRSCPAASAAKELADAFS